MWNLQNKTKRIHRYGEQIAGGERQEVEVGKMDKGGEKVQTASYKISMFWRCNILHGDCR